jgi:subtilase family serine protease
VVGVGGTTLTVSSTGVWTSETAWSGSSGGESQYETEPSYQPRVQTSGKRGIPDVAYDGNPNTGVPSYNSYNCGRACYTGWSQWGGTSIGTPQWAALFAIANSGRVAAGKKPSTNRRFCCIRMPKPITTTLRPARTAVAVRSAPPVSATTSLPDWDPRRPIC